MKKPPYASLDKGALLIASPDMDKGVFARSVILLCEHSMNGSIGLILNKTLDGEVTNEVFSFETSSKNNLRFCMGGPNQANQIMMLHSCVDESEHAIEICPSVFWGGEMVLLQESCQKESHEPVSLFFGYTGWLAGQLEKEFMNGTWFLAPATVDLVFAEDPSKLWSQVLMSLGGKCASLSTVPEDLSLN